MKLIRNADPLKKFAITLSILTLMGCGQPSPQVSASSTPSASSSASSSTSGTPAISERYDPSPEEIDQVKKAMELFKSKKAPEAVALLKETIDKNPKMEGIVREVAGQILARGGGDPAYLITSMLVEISPDESDNLRLKADAAYASKKTDESLAIYDKLILKDPKSSSLFYGRGVKRAQLGDRPTDAILDFSRAIELNPKLQQAYTNRGMLLGQLGKRKDALKDLNSALDLAPQDSIALFNRGVINSKLDQNAEAKADFEKVIELNSHPQAVASAKTQLSQLGKAPKTSATPTEKAK